MTDRRSSRLYISNLSPSCNQSELKALFEKVGAVASLSCTGDIAYLEFENPEHATTAIEKFDNYKFEGSRILVEFALKTRNFHQQPKNKWQIAKQIVQINNKFNDYMHNLDNKKISLFLYPFLRLFNPSFVIIPMGVMLSLYQNQMGLTYAAAVGVGCLFSAILKKIIRKPRPPIKDFQNKSNTYRKREPHKESMPSGDSFQAGIFLVYMAINAIYFRNESNPKIKLIQQITIIIIASMIAILVMMARIYYTCHYLIDTICGIILGAIFAIISFKKVDLLRIFIVENIFRI